MSRIGKRILTIPEGVTVEVNKMNVVIVKGPKGELKQQVDKIIKVIIKDNTISFERPNDLRNSKILHGTFNSLVNNMLIGVTKGYKKELEIVGVGYNAKLQGSKLTLSLGFSHKVEMEVPEKLKLEVPKQTEIIISGIDKQLVGEFASQIRRLKKPEPYGGKGIKYKDEVIRRKVGKAAA